MKQLIVTLGLLFSVFSTSAVLAKDGFPGRAEFPEIPVYSNADLEKNFNNVVIVDARSSLEFETLRIKGAVNIPVADEKFGSKVRQLYKETKKPIVFYCNGRSCYKSYKAAKTAMRYGVRDVYAYDAGVFEWAKAHPQHAALLGESPVDPAKIIPKDQLTARFLSPKQFTETVRSAPKNKSMVIDVRDLYQRAGVGFFAGLEDWVSLDDKKKLSTYLAKAKRENKTLYIYDEAGKQVRWLQYMLESQDIKNYYFMNKGAKGFYKEMIL